MKNIFVCNMLLALIFVGACSEEVSFEEGLKAYRDKEYGRSMSILKPIADAENAEAQSIMGDMYLEGSGVVSDVKKARHYHLQSASQGNVHSQVQICKAYFLSWMFGIKSEEYLSYCLEAASAGSSSAQNMLGVIYRDGVGVEQDFDKAVKFYKDALEKGNKVAYANLGLCYLFGLGVKKNDVTAKSMLDIAGKNDDGLPEREIGAFYLSNAYGQKNYRTAVYWLTACANKDNAMCANFLGQIYSTGGTGLEDVSKAKYWYKKAAQRGDSEAKKALDVINDIEK